VIHNHEQYLKQEGAKGNSPFTSSMQNRMQSLAPHSVNTLLAGWEQTVSNSSNDTISFVLSANASLVRSTQTMKKAQSLSRAVAHLFFLTCGIGGLVYVISFDGSAAQTGK
jgi:hypothetical protein